MEIKLSDGSVITVQGKIDRVDMFGDGSTEDGKNKAYIRVVDYKSSTHTFDLNLAQNGINIQMLLYLFALQSANDNNPTLELHPGGVSYIPSKNYGALEKEANPFRLLAMNYHESGLFIKDDVTESDLKSYNDFIFKKFDEDGKIESDELASIKSSFEPNELNQADAKLFKELRDDIIRTVTENLEEIFSGAINALPTIYSEKTLKPDNKQDSTKKDVCEYCRFKEICQNAGKNVNKIEKANLKPKNPPKDDTKIYWENKYTSKEEKTMSEDIKPNEAQINAIEHDHLFPAIVTASAGSGKTTLLVQRIVRLLSDMELNISADSLAVMTFTRNATKSMREKLNKALSKKLDALANSDTVEERERYNYLKKQLFLLRQATISTIDAFCLRMIKENAEAFDLPLNFTIADGAKKAAMQSQAMKSAMQTLYDTEFTDDERNALFFSFSFEDDEALEKTILSAAEKLESFPDPEQWIKDAVDVYKDIPSVEKEFLPLISSFLKLHVSRVVEYTKKYKSEDICNKFETEINNDPPKTKKTLDSLIKEVIPCLNKYIEFDIKRISTLEHDYNVYATNPSISNLCVLIDDLEKNSENPPDKKSRSGKNYSYKIRFKDISNIISNSVDALLEIKVNENDEKTILTSMQKTLKSFFKLLKIFMNCYELEKKTSGCIDFSDCERELYNKLSKDNEFRKQLSKRFSCIIVDEFQDSNDIQAEIFRLLGDGRLFYVGDVKQSIYSFRGADPYIMANLCKDGSGFEILPLNINYRSRTAVINTVNAAFSGLMTTKYGGVDYSKGNELNLGCELPEPNHKELYDSEIHLLYDSKKVLTTKATMIWQCLHTLPKEYKNFTMIKIS